MEPQIESVEKIKKERKATAPKEKAERGGDKRWVMFILLFTVLLSLVFYLISGNLSLSAPKGIKTNFLNGMQEAKYSY